MSNELSRNERIKEASGYLRGTLAEGLGRGRHGRDRRGRPAARQVPRHVSAGRPRPPARADEEEAREGLRLHDPPAHAGRRLHAGAVASARRDRAHLCQRHAAAHDAPDLPVPRRHQVEPQDHHEGDRRRAPRHPRRLRRRQPQRAATSRTRTSRGRTARRSISRTAISDQLLPHTPAYREIWLDGEKIAGGETEEVVEPIYGRTYLPRKFKTVVAVPPSNDVDVFAQDLGFIAILDEDGEVEGWNVTVGGGMGMTHGETDTYPRTADVMAFCRPEDAIGVAEAVVTVQRDWGDRTNRKHARLKYTIEDRGLGAVPRRSRAADRQGARAIRGLSISIRTATATAGRAERTALSHLTLFIENGRLRDIPDGPALLTGMRRIAEVHDGEFRLTANQNVIIANVRAGQPRRDRRTRRGARARPATRRRCAATPWPASRCRPAASRSPKANATCRTSSPRSRTACKPHGLAEDEITIRMTGCPNGCARPYIAEIGLVGKGPGRYNLYLGAAFDGSRLSKLYAEDLGHEGIVAALDPLFADYAQAAPQGRALRRLPDPRRHVAKTANGADFHARTGPLKAAPSARVLPWSLPMTRHIAPAETRPARLAPFAKLPIFLDLAGRFAVVAGASDAGCLEGRASCGRRRQGPRLWRRSGAGTRRSRCRQRRCDRPRFPRLGSGRSRRRRNCRSPRRTARRRRASPPRRAAAARSSTSIDEPRLSATSSSAPSSTALRSSCRSRPTAARRCSRQAIRRRIEADPAASPRAAGARRPRRSARGLPSSRLRGRRGAHFWEQFVDVAFISQGEEDERLAELERLARRHLPRANGSGRKARW